MFPIVMVSPLLRLASGVRMLRIETVHVCVQRGRSVGTRYTDYMCVYREEKCRY